MKYFMKKFESCNDILFTDATQELGILCFSAYDKSFITLFIINQLPMDWIVTSFLV